MSEESSHILGLDARNTHTCKQTHQSTRQRRGPSMHIQISNFHNIASLEYDIEDGKVNFLYGISGSGKSSIVKGLANRIDRQIDTMVGNGSKEEATVLVDGMAGPLVSAVTFNQDRQQILFSRDPDKGFYDLFIGSEEELNDLREQYLAAVSSLRSKTGALLHLKNELEALSKTLGKTAQGKLTGATKMGKAIKTYSSSSGAVRNHIEQCGMKATTWVQQGFTVDDSYEKGICPFCGQDLAHSPKNDMLAELCNLAVKDLKPLFDSHEQLVALGQNPIDLSNDEGRQRAAELVNTLPLLIKEIDHIIDYCNAGLDYENAKEMSVGLPNPNPAIYAFMPDLREGIGEVNAKAAEVKTLLGKMKSAFSTLVKSGCDELNRKLVKFGIPYRFELTTANRDEKTASYRLVHVNADNSTDMRESLSFGERNLITLILFLQDEEHEVMLIDDPASSYDDYRRTQIFKAIMGVRRRTLLVVSHDQAFVRRAVWSRERQNDRIGNIDMLCNRSGIASVEPITKESFGYFVDIIRNHINSASTYYQRMLNVRLLCEAHDIGASDETLWGYTSAILHRTSRDEVMSYLAERNESEEVIIERLKELIGNEAADLLVPLPDKVDFSTDDFSEFEKLIAQREEISCTGEAAELPDGISKNLAKDLLNDLVHMNDAMMDCIDPYKYPVWSPVLFKLLE